MRSVAVVAVPDGHGSGFVVAPGILVTNHHVIEDAVIDEVRVTFPDNDALGGRRLRTGLIHADPAGDLAFLAIDGVDVPPLRIDPEYRHSNGRQIVAVGSPGTGTEGLTLENLATDGRLGPEIRLDDGTSQWSLSMTVNGGNSGGPVIDAESGKVVGVIVAKFTETDAQSLAVPLPVLVRELAKAAKATTEERAAAASLHRQRYCLRRMAQVLGVTSFAFDRSIEAALSRSDAGGEAMDEAFNACKATAADLFAERFAHFSTTVGAEVDLLEDDPDCDPAVRRGLRKLLADIERQAEDMRSTIPSDEIEAFVGRFRGSVRGSAALIESLAERLAVKNPIGDE